MGSVISPCEDRKREDRKQVAGRRMLVVAVSLALVLGLAPALAGAATDRGSTPWPGGRWQPDAPTYGMTVDANVSVVMDDDVTLVANIGYPTDLASGERASGPFPVLLTQAPYVARNNRSRST